MNRNAGDKEKAENKVMACGCKGSHCLCALAIARANFVIDGEEKQDGTQQTYKGKCSYLEITKNFCTLLQILKAQSTKCSGPPLGTYC